MKRVLLTVLLMLSILMGPITPVQAASQGVYADSLASGWDDWSYNSITVDLGHSAHVHSGSDAVAVTYTGGWSGFQLGYFGSLDVSAYDTFRFWIHGGTAGGQNILLTLSDENGTLIEQALSPQANTWTKVDVSLTSIGSPRSVYTLAWFNNTPGAQSTFYLDDISFENLGTPPPPPGTGPALSVDASAGRHAISPYIYGINYASEAIAADLRLPVRRWGGNSTTRYNWQINVHNTGNDWYFENVPDENSPTETLPNGSASDQFVDRDQATGTESLLTIPMIGWTPKRRVEGHPFDCGFKISVYGPQDDNDKDWDPDCGNGVHNGADITGNAPTDTSVAIGAPFVTAWINHLIARYGTAANGGVQFYNLDNEPMLWNSTHRDVHPNPTTYDEMKTRTELYAAAVKAADPSAQTLGPVVWGWCAYFYSAADGCEPGPDRAAHNNTDFIPWYLQQMQAYQTAHGTRILDYLDVHIYPQIDGVYSESLGDASVQAARLRSTRQLWDTTYVHEGWIGQPVYLIPRMKSWVSANYPGTQTAITEYNWGALDYMNGALAQADLLGIFGREGLDLATLWAPPDNANAPGIFAFRMYRNYDGTGSGFGETSVQAASADQSQLAIYAAQRTADNALTVMIVNKTGSDLTSSIALDNFQSAGAAQVWQYAPANLAAIVHKADVAVTADGITATFPANSITLFVIPTGTVSATFADVPTTHWAWSWIEILYANGITGGCGTSPLVYCPNASVTRAQMAVFLERGIHGDTFTPGTPPITFTDTAGHWAQYWIEALKTDGVTGGCGGGAFCPNNPVTRAQMAVFLLTAEHGAGYTPPLVGPGTGFNDVPADYWAAAWIKQLAAEGITGGCGSGNYCPETPVTRAQMAVFLVGTFNLP
jgi:hypothetical protein